MKKLFVKIKEKTINILSPYVIKHYENKERHKLQNEDFTILCSNCIGGIIYNRLGMKFLSPTVNMWMSQRDFIKFSTNLRHYILQPLIFVDSAEETPVAKCDDILLHFNHHNNQDEAQKDWEKRKARINYDNVYIIFYNREAEHLSLEEIREIEKANCKNVACLTSIPLPLEYAVEMNPNKRLWGGYFIDKDIFGVRTFEKQWDFVNWLNSEKL